MAVLEELGSKLTDIAGIKVSFPLANDKDLILKIYARLCLLYDETWDFGDSSYSLSCKKILRLLNRVGIGHLTPTAADVTDPRRLPRVWSAFVAHLEQKYGGQGLYPRLRKVLKQQQILAARREAERERQQRMAGSARSPEKSQLADTSCSALSQDSQEDVRFAKPRPPLQKIRHLSASSSGSAASPSKAGGRSRIPVPTRPNLIPTGKQLARTPSLSGKGAPPPPQAAASNGAQPMVRLFGSPKLLVAPKAAATLAAATATLPSPPRARSDSATSESASSTGASPDGTSLKRRKSLIPAAKTPEQALGEYIENRLNAGFPHEKDAAEQSPPGADASPAPPAAAAEATLNVTYSAERPAAPRGDEQPPPLPPAEQPPSPAADAREAILQAAGDAEAHEDKENVRPVEVEVAVTAKLAGKAEGTPAAARGVRRDTFEVPAKAADQADSTAKPSETQERPKEEREPSSDAATVSTEKPETGAGDVPACGPAEQPALAAAPKSRAKKEAPKGRTKKSAKPAATATPAAEIGTATVIIPASSAAEAAAETADRADGPETADPAPAQSAQEPVTAPAEEPSKKRRRRPKKEAEETDKNTPTEGTGQSELPDSAAAEAPQVPATDVVQVGAPKKRGGRTKKVKQAINDTPADVEVAPISEVVTESTTDPPANGVDQGELPDSASAEVLQEPATAALQEAPKKRGSRAKKAKQVPNDDVPAKATPVDVEVAPVPEVAPASEATIDTPVNGLDQLKSLDSTPAEATQVVATAPAEEAPKKRSGKVRKEAKKVVDVPTETTTEAPANDADQQEVPDSAPGEAPQEPAPAKEAPKKRRGRAKKEENPVSEEVNDVPAISEDVPVTVEASSTPEIGEVQTGVSAAAPAEVLQVAAEEAVPKKRRGRAKKEEKPVSEEVNDVPAISEDVPVTEEASPTPEIGEVQTGVSVAAPAEVLQVAAEEAALKKRRGRAKKEEKPVSEEVNDVPAIFEDVPLTEEDSSTPEIGEVQMGVSAAAPAEVLQVAAEQAAPKKRRGRAKKEAKPVAEEVVPTKATVPLTEEVPATEVAPVPDAPEASTEQAEPAEPPADPAGEASKPARASRRKTPARTQKSTDTEADDGDPDWAPDVTVTSSYRGRRTAAKEAHQPAADGAEAAATETDPAAVRGRGRRTRHDASAVETSETPVEESAESAVPSGTRAGRTTRASRTSSAADQTVTAARKSTRGGRKTPDLPSEDPEEAAPSEPASGRSRRSAAARTAAPTEEAAPAAAVAVAEEPAESAPAPRRRRLRVVLESDSEGGTPPEPVRADAAPSPALLQRPRRGRKTAEDAGRPRRALRALENCD